MSFKGRRMLKKMPRRTGLIIILVAIAVIVGSCAAGPEIIKLAGQGTIAGEVAFTHEKHLKDAEEGGYGILCEKCHHLIWQVSGLPSRKCRTCHRSDNPKAKIMEEVAHDFCMSCHEQHANARPSSKVPKSCPDCHVFKEDQK
jgi:predicted CXXCH cytochrome family protein